MSWDDEGDYLDDEFDEQGFPIDLDFIDDVADEEMAASQEMEQDAVNTSRELVGREIDTYLGLRFGQHLSPHFRDRIRGMALLFAGKNERSEPVLAVNSIEASPKLREDGNKGDVFSEAYVAIGEFAREAGFKQVIMGEHPYNPGGKGFGEKIDFEKFEKLNNLPGDFYSDIGVEYGEGNVSGYSKIL